MHKYFFIFGKTPKLSKAELENVLKLHSIEFNQVIFNQEIFLFETSTKISLNIFNQLGGSVKFGEIIGKTKKINSDELIKFIQINQTKLTFGLSDYSKQNLNVKKLGMEMKKIIKGKTACRFVSPKNKTLTAVAVKKNKLLDKGIEICIFQGHETFLIGKTLAVQDFELWNKLDYGRPEYDPKIGMLPPKVAQMMINLIPGKADSLWDPFCGFGTILQQAAMLNYKKIFGSDLSEFILQRAGKNIKWLQNEFKIKTRIKLKTLNIEKTKPSDLPFKPKAVVTEPYMGKALIGREKRPELFNMKLELQKLYLNSFSQFIKILPKKSHIIFIFPKFKYKNELIDTGIDEDINSIGFKLLNEFAYSRPNQHLIRRITVWENPTK